MKFTKLMFVALVVIQVSSFDQFPYRPIYIRTNDALEKLCKLKVHALYLNR